MNTKQFIGKLIFVEDLLDFYVAHALWSQETFGNDQVRGPIGPLKHLAKEAIEAAEKPGDITEYADCFLLLCDAVRRGGFTLVDMLTASREKLEVNKARSWQKPTNPNEAIEHLETL